MSKITLNVNGLNNYSKGRTLEKIRSNHTLSNEDTVDSKIERAECENIKHSIETTIRKTEWLQCYQT